MIRKSILLLLFIVVFAGVVSATSSRVMEQIPQSCCIQYDGGSRFYPNMTSEERMAVFDTIPKDITCCDGLENREECRTCFESRGNDSALNKTNLILILLYFLVFFLLPVSLLLLLMNSIIFTIKKKGFLSKKWRIILSIVLFLCILIPFFIILFRPRL